MFGAEDDMSLRPTVSQQAYEQGILTGSYNRQFNGLSPAEHERLTILFEEMAEATQIVGKILRHGYESYHPRDVQHITNRKLLETELGHVVYAVGALVRERDINPNRIHSSEQAKAQSIGQYLHHQGPSTPNLDRLSRFDVPGFPYVTTAAAIGYQHDWDDAGAYRVCAKCALSDMYVYGILKGDDQLCKVK